MLVVSSGRGPEGVDAEPAEQELTDHFSIAVEEGRTVPLPVTDPGEAP